MKNKYQRKFLQIKILHKKIEIKKGIFSKRVLPHVIEIAFLKTSNAKKETLLPPCGQQHDLLVVT